MLKIFENQCNQLQWKLCNMAGPRKDQTNTAEIPDANASIVFLVYLTSSTQSHQQNKNGGRSLATHDSMGHRLNNTNSAQDTHPFTIIGLRKAIRGCAVSRPRLCGNPLGIIVRLVSIATDPRAVQVRPRTHTRTHLPPLHATFWIAFDHVH